MEQLGCYWTDFHEIRYLGTFIKFIEKIKALLKSDENEGFFIMEKIYILDLISIISSYNQKYFRQTCRETRNTFYAR